MTYDQQHWIEQYEQAGAWRNGHFVLTSGLHSPVYFDKMVILSQPWLAEPICAGLAQKILEKFEDGFTHIVSPAVGAVVEGYETSRQLWLKSGDKTPAFFAERDAKMGEGMHLKRPAFILPQDARVLFIEDVITTGKSVDETIDAVRRQQPAAEVVGIATLLDRSNGKAAALGHPLVSLVEMDIPTYSADALPLELSRIPAIKSGSRPQP